MKTAKFYLLDGDKLHPPKNKEIKIYDNNFITFNTWEPVLDAINTNDFDINDFTFWSPNTEWNGKEYIPSKKSDAQFENVQVDMVISKSSCGLHYPIDVYWEKILKILKPPWLPSIVSEEAPRPVMVTVPAVPPDEDVTKALT